MDFPMKHILKLNSHSLSRYRGIDHLIPKNSNFLTKKHKKRSKIVKNKHFFNFFLQNNQNKIFNTIIERKMRSDLILNISDSFLKHF